MNHEHDNPWPENWKEILDRSPNCDRCGAIWHRLYILSAENPNILVCENCSDAYFAHKRKFAEEIELAKKERKKRMSNEYKGI